MLKEVGASGQISLGKKYAGQLFDVVFYPDGRVELVPMKAVPAVYEINAASVPSRAQEEAGTYRVGDGWLTPERLAARKAAQERSPEEIERLAVQWEADNKDTIAAYNGRIEREGSMGWRIYEWRKKQAALKAPGAEPG
ncbi:hypothetical protein [Polaromonas sp.]|uniref:hypothetical protein n=1 Tax=Polaromonas sp. TaxID=1869339 RepID=UPI003751D213